MPLELPDVAVAIAQRAQRSSSHITAVGAYAIVVATTLPAQALTLTSAYLGAIDGDTAVSHLLLAPAAPAELEQHIVAGLSGERHPRACLLDHAAELQAVLCRRFDGGAQIDVGPVALERAAGAWATDPAQR